MHLLRQTSRSSTNDTAAPTPFARRTAPYFVVLLVLQLGLAACRWMLGDAHGGVLMLAVCAVGLFTLLMRFSGVYSAYFGLMSFVTGLLDMNLAVENLVWLEWSAWRHWHEALRGQDSKLDLNKIMKPAMYLICAAVQLAAAFVAFLLYRDAEAMEEGEWQDEPLLATPEQTRIYNAALSHNEFRESASGTPRSSPKAFMGSAHKLP
mmetsp:Transcript_5371/g.15872  ORF Transcript_5371/g.15872 Transcript_5371/m.15872 type:complete len:207 (-) Transcript_5371:50-670(-)